MENKILKVAYIDLEVNNSIALDAAEKIIS